MRQPVLAVLALRDATLTTVALWGRIIELRGRATVTLNAGTESNRSTLFWRALSN